MSKKICITGISGQYGARCAEMLLEKYPDCKIYGLKRRSSSHNTERIDHIYQDPHCSPRMELVYGDLSDYGSLLSFVGDIKPDYFINAGAQSHVKISEIIGEYTFDVVATGVVRVLDAIRRSSPHTKFLQLSSSEMFGNSVADPETNKQNELTPFQPCSLYACAKVAAHHSTVYYRNAYKLFASTQISFNMESEKRAENFLPRKVTRACTRIAMGLQNELFLGCLTAKRDWNYLDDSINASIKILEADEPDDFVVATGESHSVQEFVEIAFSKLNLDWKKYVKFDPRYLRSQELNVLCGDAAKIKNKLGWQPQYTFSDLIDKMLEHDLKLAQQEKSLKDSVK